MQYLQSTSDIAAIAVTHVQFTGQHLLFDACLHLEQKKREFRKMLPLTPKFQLQNNQNVTYNVLIKKGYKSYSSWNWTCQAIPCPINNNGLFFLSVQELLFGEMFTVNTQDEHIPLNILRGPWTTTFSIDIHAS